MSQRELALRTGLDPSTISRLERAKGDVTYSTLLNIAEVTGTTVSALTDDTRPPETLSDETAARLPAGPIAEAVELLQSEVLAVREMAETAQRLAEEAKREASRRPRRSA